jgi:5,10-methylenetetrahydromethanopterin reductase
VALSFGIRLPPCGPLRDVGAAAREAEAAGFDHVWTLDSPLLAGRLLDPYLALGACAATTARARLGVAVTNPFIRHPIATAAAILGLDDLSGGRAILGLGSGDSAMRTLGLAAADDVGTHAGRRRQLRETVEMLAAVFAGKSVSFGPRAFQLETARRPIPIYVAATGARMLELAGAVADGVIFQVGVEERCVAWAIERIHAGARGAGRDPARVDVVCSTFTAIDEDRRRAIDRARPLAAWFYGVAPELLQMAGIEVTRRVPLSPVFPDISHPADHERAMDEARRYVTDAAVERMCLVGPAAECVERIRRLAGLGVGQIFFRHYLTYRLPTELIETAGCEILPRLR